MEQKAKYDVFISYSRRNRQIVYQIAHYLIDNGISVWIDKDGIESGDAFKSVIVSAIERSSIFLFFSSEASNNSEWTIKEVNTAIYKKKTIIPIKLDNTEYSSSLPFDLIGLDYIEINDDIELQKKRILKSISKYITHEPVYDNISATLKEGIKTTHKSRFSDKLTNLFTDRFHPLINLGIAVQFLFFALILSMLIWTFAWGSLAFYHNPQVSHAMLILAVSASLFTTYKLHSCNVIWIGALFVLDFIEIFLICRLGSFLYTNWHLLSDLPQPQSIRYQLLYQIGHNVAQNSIMGIHPFLFYALAIHIAVILILFNLKKDGERAWDIIH